MAFNGSGIFERLYNFVNDRDASVPIEAPRMDAELDGIATGLSNCITKDGQTTATAVVPFSAGISPSHILIGNGTLAEPAIRFASNPTKGIYHFATDSGGLVAGGAVVIEWDGASISAATGIRVISNAAGSAVRILATSSGTNEDLKIDAKGSGTITLNSQGTGEIVTTRTVRPAANDGAALGTSAISFSDLFLASDAVINFNAGDVTITHSADALTIAGGTLSAPSIIPTGSTVPTNGMYLPSSNTLGFATNSTVAFTVGAENEVSGISSIRGTSFLISDDAATYVQLPAATSSCLLFFASSGAPTSTTPSGLVHVRFAATAAVTSIQITDATNVTLSAVGALTGTTGTDGKLTISVDSTNRRIYIENRLGNPRNFAVTPHSHF